MKTMLADPHRLDLYHNLKFTKGKRIVIDTKAIEENLTPSMGLGMVTAP